jgi:acyl carrier protein
MTETNVQENVMQIFSTMLGAAVDMSTSRTNMPAWNSLKHMEIMFAIEEQFDIQFSELELSELDSLSEIVDALSGKHAT